MDNKFSDRPVISSPIKPKPTAAACAVSNADSAFSTANRAISNSASASSTFACAASSNAAADAASVKSINV